MDARFRITPARHSRNFILLLMLMQIMFALLLGEAHAVQEWEIISEEENLEMEKQLKVINKPPIRSFRTEHGDILDCIDIYKQHAFDHPLLKDHKVQMKPKRLSEEMMGGKSPRFLPRNIRCPPGSVLIKRTTKEDLIMAKKIKALGMNYPKSFRFHSTDAVPDGYNYFAYAKYNTHNFGAKATLNVWNPRVSPNQASLANIWIANGPAARFNVLQAGWGVKPNLFSDNHTRLIAAWTSDNSYRTGCFNYACPGFVQVSRKISLGLVLEQTSTYNGTQVDLEMSILKREGEWWLQFYDEFIGYWPHKLVPFLYVGGNLVYWGGVSYCPKRELTPEMGSGHFPKHGLDGKSAYIKKLQIYDDFDRFVYPDSNLIEVITTRPECYGALITPDDAAPHPMNLFYGGPGRCTPQVMN